ncbi:MAG: hypothetical protein J5873_01265 [Bacteroidales bacterium]|nr:hypothetical protein [Bacteroidales bacterium]
MRKWLMAAGCLLLMAACRHGEKKQQTEQPAEGPVETQTLADSLPLRAADSAKPAFPNAKEVQQALQQDSAEVTNLRLLARKQRVIYDPLLLVGEWQHGTEHEVYLADGTGYQWDTSDDVAREEAQPFQWRLDSNLLTIICRLQRGGIVPRRYVVTYADDESLSYSDNYGGAFLWDKKSRDTASR